MTQEPERIGMRRRRLTWTSVLATVVVVVVIAGGLYFLRPLIAKVWLKGILYTLQEHLEDYKGANGYYPDHLADLEELEGYHLPMDPVSVLTFHAPRKLREVKLGDFTPGGLVYYSYIKYGERVDAYYLGAYGFNPHGGRDCFRGSPSWNNTYDEDEMRDGKPEGLIMLLTEPPRVFTEH